MNFEDFFGLWISWWCPNDYYKRIQWRVGWNENEGGLLTNQASHQIGSATDQLEINFSKGQIIVGNGEEYRNWFEKKKEEERKRGEEHVL